MNMNERSSKPVLVCAIGLLAAFFMPWVQFLGVGVSGYKLGSLGSYGNYAWIIPILAGATIVLTFSGIDNRRIGAISGVVPLAAITVGYMRLSGQNGATQGIMHVLSIGAFLTIIFSAAMIVAALVERPKSAAQVHPAKA